MRSNISRREQILHYCNSIQDITDLVYFIYEQSYGLMIRD
jgi:hypothetical protein